MYIKTMYHFVHALFFFHIGLIYLVGGISDLGIEMALTECYNPITKECVRLADMNVKRAYVGVATMDRMLYAVGGWNDDLGALKSVERLNVNKVGGAKYKHLMF